MHIAPRQIKYYTLRNIHNLPQYSHISPDEQWALKVVGQVLPFRVNNYVTDELIDWGNVPDDPMFQLTFMQQSMLEQQDFATISDALRRDAPKAEMAVLVARVRHKLNPHPAGQMTANVPILEEDTVAGIQHKYRETCLVFPSKGQTCHAYCTFCFRWPQFVGMDELRFATGESRRFQIYLREHKEITDVLFTGGDPMVMSVRNLASFIEPLLAPEFDHIQSIRIGTKSLSYWPHRFVSDKDADDVLRLFESVVASGKHLALMGHFNHWKELSTSVAQEAIRRVRSTGAEIRTQSPLIKGINDDAGVWVRMWKEQVRLGCIPYYMFIERDTGARHYFAVPLYRAWEIFQQAYQQVSGLGRTVRGPSMSAYPGKVEIAGVAEVAGEKVFVLSFLQARNPDLVKRPFFARYDREAIWLNDLKPAFGKSEFFYKQESSLPLAI